MIDAYLGLGSNLEQPIRQLRQAAHALVQLPHCEGLEKSPIYRSAPVGPGDQPDYYNAVIKMPTQLSPHVLLDHLQCIEQQQGRERIGERWGPRTLDIDILLFGKEIIDTPRLTVPHREMHWRNFVLYPLFDLTPTLTLPNGRSLNELIDKCPPDGLEVTDISW